MGMAGARIERDALAVLANTERWHAAMRSMGRPAVEAALRRRPGRPTDAVDDVGTELPYPTREFCEQWCTDQDNIVFQFSPRSGVVLGLFVVVFACLLRAYSDFGSMQNVPVRSMGPRPAATGDAPMAAAAPPGIYNGPAFQPALQSSSQQQSASQLPSLQQTLQQNLLPQNPRPPTGP
jgi:hypothetical protein